MYGDTIIEIGTSGGGSIEVYETVDYANTRNDYLASFDGTVISSGSHKVIGTCIVRTSDLLTASNQKNWEQKFTNALTNVRFDDENGSTYFYNASGPRTGWIKDGENWLYADESGKLVKLDWIEEDGEQYWFDSTGVMVADITLDIDGTDYSFDSSGALITEYETPEDE